jgi:CO/xanthine dehydrogenase FAD-binding subunit
MKSGAGLGHHSPTSLEQALDILGRGGVSVLAGGTDWFPSRGDLPVREDILDITRLPGFRGITRQDGGWRIGAATRWADIVRADLPAAFDGLKAAAREVGSVQIQNTGTVAGNLCNASPAADGVPPLLTLDARLELVSRAGVRVLPLEDFILGVRKTALKPDELVSAVTLPDAPEGARGHFLKLGARKYLVISIAMVAGLIALREGRIVSARIAVGSCSPVARRLPGLEAALIGCSLAKALGGIGPDHLVRLAPISDVRANAEYRLEAVAEACRRIIQAAFRGM